MQERIRSLFKRTEVDLSRRNVLKFLLVGGAAFTLGKLAGPITSFFTGERVLHEAIFTNFRVTETNKTLTFADKDGTPIFIIDKDAF
ncbi:MAG TPA: twin-arginine translocation signal domain-containing protein [Candidatus Paceibacterota bacterium]|nr:twin-arginine translocation signal domain-containing protein [Candidatus Paceibacterota bacterium]